MLRPLCICSVNGRVASEGRADCLERAFEPSMMRGAAQRDRGAFDEIADQRCTVAAFSGAPLHDAERMLVAVHIDADRRHQGHVLVHVNAVDLDDHQPETGKIGPIHSFSRAAERNKRLEAADFRQARAFGRRHVASGKRIERWNLRVRR